MELGELNEDNLEALLLRQASERRKKRSRRGSSPFPADGNPLAQDRRRLSSFTTISGDETVISIDDADATEEEILENMRLYKYVIESIKNQPWRMKKKYNILRRAKSYVNKHEGELVHSKRSKDILAKYKVLMNKWFQRFKRVLANLVVTLTPWEMRIKRIESHFGSVVASYFTFLRWVFWINFFITTFVCCFLMVPEVLRGQDDSTGMRKEIESEEQDSALNLKAIWDFEGYLKYSPLFYGYYSNREMTEEGYRLPLAYFLTSLAVYIFSFFAILRRMAENSRMSKLSEKDEECTFTWKLFTGWDYMIGHAETAFNKTASLIMSFKEAILEEKEKKKEERDWKVIILRIIANFMVIILLASSAYAVVLVVQRSQEAEAESSWWRQNEVTFVVSFISIVFPNLFELIGMLEQYHPRVQLRWQLARILMLYLLNLYTLIFALYGKVDKMTTALFELKTNISTLLEQKTFLSTVFPSSEFYQTLNTTMVEPYHTPISLNLQLLHAENDSAQPKTTACNFTLLLNCTTIILSWIRNVAAEKKLGLNGTNESKDGLINKNGFYNFSGIEEDNDAVEWLNVWNYTDINFSNDATLVKNNNTTQTDSFRDDVLNRILKTPFANISDVHNDTYSLILNKSLQNWLANHIQEIDSKINDSIYNCVIFISKCIEGIKKMSENDVFMSSTWPFEVDPLVTTTSKTPIVSYDSDEESTTSSSTTDLIFANASTLSSCDGLECLSDVTKGSTLRNEVPTTTAECLGSECSKEQDIVQLILHSDESTREQLRKLCWETMFGQELVKLTVMDLIMTIISIILMDFIRAIFVRYANNCWCWDLEKKFPGYGDFKIAENILHLVNNQGMIWMGMFFSPGLPALNTVKLCILMYVRSWAVLTCNIPHENVFKASRSNNFYFALLLIMLFLCTLPVGFAIVWLEPSWHCGPFSGYGRIYRVFTSYLRNVLPSWMNNIIEYLTSPGLVIPLLLLLVLIIYYLISLTGSLREANNDLKIQLRRERSHEKEASNDANAGKEGGGGDKTLANKWLITKNILPVLPTCNKFRELNHLTETEIEQEDEESHTTDTSVKRQVQYPLRTEENHLDSPSHRLNDHNRITEESPRRGGDGGTVPLITISHPIEKHTDINKTLSLPHQCSTDSTGSVRAHSPEQTEMTETSTGNNHSIVEDEEMKSETEFSTNKIKNENYNITYHQGAENDEIVDNVNHGHPLTTQVPIQNNHVYVSKDQGSVELADNTPVDIDTLCNNLSHTSAIPTAHENNQNNTMSKDLASTVQNSDRCYELEGLSPVSQSEMLNSSELTEVNVTHLQPSLGDVSELPTYCTNTENEQPEHPNQASEISTLHLAIPTPEPVPETHATPLETSLIQSSRTEEGSTPVDTLLW
ncbi:LOW QUALITY PROTEIN: transmembrane channel-like protein 2 [Limulus polyphemus]|uniref:LOW QUALITY PROTEIN: transmembrane channel-like protein 2 n=1 Tax=Limulus polyphemus TaxID=6850 RepID=A0ABM1T054_LIMPO|nr:LOW QUALITY PROTEIN: transmembrane channel-like protein 2 [Limulus polyphemus]